MTTCALALATPKDKFACHTCLAAGDTRLCGGCRVVRYCGATCQRRDWPAHKDFCGRVQSVRGETGTEEDLYEYFERMSERAIAARGLASDARVVCLAWSDDSFITRLYALPNELLSLLEPEQRETLATKSFVGYDARHVVRSDGTTSWHAFTIAELETHAYVEQHRGLMDLMSLAKRLDTPSIVVANVRGNKIECHLVTK